MERSGEMRKMSWLLVLVLVGGLTLSACESCKKGTSGEVVVDEEVVEEVSPKDAEAASKISNTLSGALCKKMVECAPGTMTEEECVTQTTQSLTEALKEKPINVSEDQLKTCADSIKSGTCEEVLGAEPPKGCEFLK